MYEFPVVKFWGSSDDLVEVEGDVEGCDEYNVAPLDGIYAGAWRVSDVHNDQRCLVHAFYDGLWFFAVSQDEESKHLPHWDFRIHHRPIVSNNYTTMLSMVVPKTTKIEQLVNA